MKQIFYKGSALAGILAGSLMVSGQSGTGATGAGTARGVGAAGINQPAASAPAGGANIIGPGPNSIGGRDITAQSPGAPSAAGTVGISPGSGTPGSDAPQVVPPNALGNPVQNNAAANLGLANVQAGIPLGSLSPTLRQSIQSQLGNSQVQTISRDDTANGSIFRITTAQNGVPTEMRFGANGTFLGSTALPGTATSFFTPGSAVIFDTLPSAVQSTIRGQAGNGRIGNIVPQSQGYVVTYDVNGQPTTMLVGPDGRVLRAGPTAVGTAPSGTVGSGAITHPAQRQTTNSARASAIQLNDLPEVPVIAIGAQPPQTDISSGIPLSRVPVAIREAVKAYATASEVRSVNLGLDNGKTVYDIVYMRDGRRDRMIIAKDGSILRTERDVSAALDNGPAAPRLAIGDLPMKVRDTISRQTDNVLVKDVVTRRLGDQVVYSVRYETNGAPVELLVDSDGAVVITETSSSADNPNGPRPAPVPTEGEVVRTVSATPSIDAAGRSPAIEARTATSADQNSEPEPAKSVSLNDVPLAVQNSAKKLAGASVIESIKPTLGDDGVLYEVTLSNEGDRQILRLNKDGAVRQNISSSKP